MESGFLWVSEKDLQKDNRQSDGSDSDGEIAKQAAFPGPAFTLASRWPISTWVCAAFRVSAVWFTVVFKPNDFCDILPLWQPRTKI